MKSEEIRQIETALMALLQKIQTACHCTSITAAFMSCSLLLEMNAQLFQLDTAFFSEEGRKFLGDLKPSLQLAQAAIADGLEILEKMEEEE